MNLKDLFLWKYDENHGFKIIWKKRCCYINVLKILVLLQISGCISIWYMITSCISIFTKLVFLFYNKIRHSLMEAITYCIGLEGNDRMEILWRFSRKGKEAWWAAEAREFREAFPICLNKPRNERKKKNYYKKLP